MLKTVQKQSALVVLVLLGSLLVASLTNATDQAKQEKQHWSLFRGNSHAQGVAQGSLPSPLEVLQCDLVALQRLAALLLPSSVCCFAVPAKHPAH